ncbi:membrane protein [Bacteroidia bacterium]|nr:membrane protein [Bacteroidia bacterium]
MFRFEHPEYLYLLFSLPALLALFILSMIQKKKALKRFGYMPTIRLLMPDVSLKKQYYKFWILLACIALFVFIIARPQFGSKLETVKKKGVEVMVCLDVSNSMLSNDITPTRLEKSKQILSKLVDNLKDDKIGLIVFAGDAFIQLPITSDYVSAKMFLSSINPSMVPTQGTAIGAALNLAMKSFTPSETSEKTIILITDGENHEDDALGAAKAAAEKNIKVNVLGVGSTQGAPIPVGGANNFLKDAQGNVIITQLNEQMCQEIAAAGNGIYTRTDNTNSALKAIQSEIDKMSKSDIESKVYSDYDEKYQILAWIVLFLLILEFFIMDRKNRIFKKIKLFS